MRIEGEKRKGYPERAKPILRSSTKFQLMELGLLEGCCKKF